MHFEVDCFEFITSRFFQRKTFSINKALHHRIYRGRFIFMELLSCDVWSKVMDIKSIRPEWEGIKTSAWVFICFMQMAWTPKVLFGELRSEHLHMRCDEESLECKWLRSYRTVAICLYPGARRSVRCANWADCKPCEYDYESILSSASCTAGWHFLADNCGARQVTWSREFIVLSCNVASKYSRSYFTMIKRNLSGEDAIFYNQ